MKDNKTSQAAALYDSNVHKTIPRYHTFHEETLDLIQALNPAPAVWLDAGCGTGTLIAKAAERFTGVRFIAADPSAAMLELAKAKLAGLNVDYISSGSEALGRTDKVDVITAIMSHHYLDAQARADATKNCFDSLKNGGVYVTFETIRPFSEAGVSLGLQRWRMHQLANGKPQEEVEKHISRYGIELLPISIADHLTLLKETGFASAEILWASGLQAGFYAVK